MEDIKDRLAHILRAKNLTASQFAELMGIQPSNVSHLLNGRNKPSLDFLIKLKDVFPEYSFDWIILGKKPITINEPNPVNLEDNTMKFEDIDDDLIGEFDDLDAPIDNNVKNSVANNQNNEIVSRIESDVDKMVLVYNDKTFEILYPKK